MLGQTLSKYGAMASIGPILEAIPWTNKICWRCNWSARSETGKRNRYCDVYCPSGLIVGIQEVKIVVVGYQVNDETRVPNLSDDTERRSRLTPFRVSAAFPISRLSTGYTSSIIVLMIVIGALLRLGFAGSWRITSCP